MDLHDYQDVAENYDLYITGLMQNQPTLCDNFLEFHLELAANHGADGILDLACGTGALSLPLAEQGHRVYAVDLSPAMLDVLQQKIAHSSKPLADKISLIPANMTTFSIPVQVTLALIARSGFLHLTTTEDQIKTLVNINRHLQPGGLLCFNNFDPAYAFIAGNCDPEQSTPHLQVEYTNTRGNREKVYNQIWFNLARQLIEGYWIFEEMDQETGRSTQRKRPVTLRWTFRSEIELLARLCGFEIINLYGGYDKSEPKTGGNLVWVLQKHSAPLVTG